MEWSLNKKLVFLTGSQPGAGGDVKPSTTAQWSSGNFAWEALTWTYLNPQILSNAEIWNTSWPARRCPGIRASRDWLTRSSAKVIVSKAEVGRLYRQFLPIKQEPPYAVGVSPDWTKDSICGFITSFIAIGYTQDKRSHSHGHFSPAQSPGSQSISECGAGIPWIRMRPINCKQTDTTVL